MAPGPLASEYLIVAALLAAALLAGGTAWFRRHRRSHTSDKLFAALRAAHEMRLNAPPPEVPIEVEGPVERPQTVLTREEPPMHVMAIAANEEMI